ncbi:hypothetical protein FQN50_004719 [Emmonsiellopsis sp. PD_5]|nr:hypothetical protein FQN50_004719 [Emmonsiellopsis sp. PD_5]
MSTLLFRGGRATSVSRAISSKRLFSRTFSSSSREQRLELLKKIYAPVAHLEKGSSEYDAIAASGKCWSGYFDPGNLDRYGFRRVEEAYRDLLVEVDSYRPLMKLSTEKIGRMLVTEYAQQSTAIEDNHLRLGDSLRIAESLDDKFFRHVDLASLPASDLPTMRLPPCSELLPVQDPNQVAEVRNHIVATKWVAEVAPRHPGTPGLSEHEICALNALLIKDTESEQLYSSGWGGRSLPGSYRNLPIGVRSNPLRIFPYPQEVPNLIREFFAWRDNAHNQQLLHPLLLACHLTVYFVFLHPFLDGNGRVSRTLMQDYLIRQGYIPVVMQDLEREEYVAMISDAQDGKPEAFVDRVLSTQLDMMRTFHSRNLEVD